MRHKYRVMFHAGPELSASTIASQGFARFDRGTLTFSSETQSISVQGSEIREIKFYHFSGVRVMRIETGERRIFTSVIRVMIGQLALGNYFQTRELFDRIVSMAPGAIVVDETHGMIGWKRRLIRIAGFAVVGFCCATVASMALSYVNRH